MRSPRQQIVDAANKQRLKNGWVLKPYTMRRLQWAVHVVRQNHLVSDDVLMAAGFNPARRRLAAVA